MENDKFIVVDDETDINSSSLERDKSEMEITNIEKLDILTKMIQEVEEKLESDPAIKKLVK
jgi:hypothetical protein